MLPTRCLLTKQQALLLLSYGILYSFLVLYCRFYSARDPGSYFFQPEEGYRPYYSAKRMDEATAYMARFNDSSSRESKVPIQEQGKAFCIGIVTVKRPLMQNLDVTVGSLFEGLSPDERSSIALHVLFAHTNASEHPVYSHPWVPAVVDKILTYDAVAAPLAALARLEQAGKVPEKSLIDYRLSLASCYHDTSAPWILMLEDDVLAQRRWYAQTTRGLETIASWHQRGSLQPKAWLYLRLFYTEKFLGWNAEEWPVYLVWSVVVVALAGLAGLSSRRKIRSLQGTLTNPFLAVICFVCVPSGIALYFLAGHMSVQPLRPGIHVMNRYGCCSQALVFPRDQVPLVMEHLDAQQATHPVPVDSAIELLADHEGLDRLAISPSPMQHVGAASYKENRKSYAWTGPHRVQGAHGVWSVGFEQAYA